MDHNYKYPKYYNINQRAYFAKLKFLKEIYLTAVHILKILLPGKEI